MIATLMFVAASFVPGPVEVVVTGLDRRFEGALPPTAWHESGVEATVTLSHFEVDLHRHRLVLSPRTDRAGCCRAQVELELSGRGLASVEVDGTPLRLADELLAPRQVIALDGIVAVEIGPGGAVSLVLVQGPERVTARVDSRLAGQLGLACTLVLGPGPCAALSARLGRVEAKGPEPGVRLDLPPGAIDATTVARLSAMLPD